MRMLMVTPYPPVRDGIAAYAVQWVQVLRAQGNEVEVLSPGPSAAHHHLDLVGPRGALALAKRLPSYDRIIVQFHPDFFYPAPATPADRARVDLALTVAFRRARQIDVVIHEIDLRWGRRGTLAGLFARQLWRSVDRIYVHTERERDSFARSFGVRRRRIEVAEHGANFVQRTRHDRASARKTLGIPQAAFTFLLIGFIQPTKGFDRAVRAFEHLGGPDVRLDIVGSVRVDQPALQAYRDELRRLVTETAGAHLHEGYVSDELFDRWIVAADVVVLPYRWIWSSGVLERAHLCGRPVIATEVGGLREQLGKCGQATIVADDVELRQAMQRACVADPAPRNAAPWPAIGLDLRGQLQQEIVSRAAAGRGSRLMRSALDQSGMPRAAGSASAPLRRVRPLDAPAPTSARPLGRIIKRIMLRLTGWEVAPLVQQVNLLRTATVEAIETAASTDAQTRHPRHVPNHTTNDATDADSVPACRGGPAEANRPPHWQRRSTAATTPGSTDPLGSPT